MTIELIKQLMDTCYLAKRARDLLPPLPDGVTSSYIQYLDVIQRLEAKGVRARVSDLSDALNLLLGKDLKKKLYDLHRDEDGIVDGEAVTNDFVQILLDYKAGKNS